MATLTSFSTESSASTAEKNIHCQKIADRNLYLFSMEYSALQQKKIAFTVKKF
jgi:hypothetical protein